MPPMTIGIATNLFSREHSGGLKGQNSRPRWGGVLRKGSDSSPHQRGSLGSTVSSPARFGAEQMHFGRTKSSENVSIGHKCPLIPVSQFDLVFGVLLILDSWGLGGGIAPQCLCQTAGYFMMS